MPGEVHCILGENGAGKSTLCNLIFGVHCRIDGDDALSRRNLSPDGPGRRARSGIAMVHQHFSLVHDMTVVDNVILGQQRGHREHARMGRSKLERLANEYGFALDPYAKIDELSVGERQRVEIVKCLIREPRLFVLDEPTAVLLPDEIARAARRVPARRRRRRGVVLVTHKLAEIKKVADRVTVLARRPRGRPVRPSGRGNRRSGARDDPGRSRVAGQICRLDAWQSASAEPRSHRRRAE